MFWAKCGKILTDESDYPLNCPSSPCGYYSVFGIKYRSLDSQTMQPIDECSWSYDVFPAQVKASKIQWDYSGGICIQVSQNRGLVAKKKINGLQIQVYNLAGCYEDYEEFIAYYDSFGGQQAWNQYFCSLYMLSYTIRYQVRGQCWWQQACYTEQKMEKWCTTYCINIDGNSCQNIIYDENGNAIQCLDQGCFLQEYCQEYPLYPISVGCLGYMLHEADGDSLHKMYIPAGGYFDETTGYVETCFDRQKAYTVMGGINSKILEIANTKTEYRIYSDSYYGAKGTGTWTQDCTNSNSLCCIFAYESGPFENYYGSLANDVSMFRWGRMKLEKNSSTPSDVKGIKFKLILTNKKWNDGKGNISSSESVSEEQIILNFDDDYYSELPTATDITLWTLLKNIECLEDGSDCNSANDGCKIHSQPITNDYEGLYANAWDQNVKREKYTVKLIGIEYIR